METYDVIVNQPVVIDNVSKILFLLRLTWFSLFLFFFLFVLSDAFILPNPSSKLERDRMHTHS